MSASNTTPIAIVTKAQLPDWLERNPSAKTWTEANKFTAAPGSFLFFPDGEGHIERVLAAPFDDARVWSLAALPMALPEGRYRFETPLDRAAATEIALGWRLGSYAFSRYKAPKRAPAALDWPEESDRNEVERLAAAVFLARDLINTPAADMGPSELAQAGMKIAHRHRAEARLIVGDGLLDANYPAIHAVGRASSRPPALLDFTWGRPDAPRVTLVGKGVCFDTGGLDIKPADGMLEMKRDMGGAAIMLGLADALMAADTQIRLRVMTPIVENSISGNAMRPRDVIRTRCGKTVEIGNTDAEGRLILCDALSEADSESPDLLVDCATLTGAAKIALGAEIQALYCDDDSAAAAMQQAGVARGDPLWRMPIWRGYRKLLDTDIADLNNVAKTPLGGSIVAAVYLADFVSAAKTWAHLDVIAANTIKRPGRPEGGEATGLRALYAYIRERYA